MYSYLCSVDAYVDADLVWSSDFQKTLKAKQMKRSQAEESCSAVAQVSWRFASVFGVFV